MRNTPKLWSLAKQNQLQFFHGKSTITVVIIKIIINIIDKTDDGIAIIIKSAKIITITGKINLIAIIDFLKLLYYYFYTNKNIFLNLIEKTF